MYTHVCQNLNDPETLIHKIYLDISFYTGRYGREGLRKLRKDSFEIKTNAEGRKYMIMTQKEENKVMNQHPE